MTDTNKANDSPPELSIDIHEMQATTSTEENSSSKPSPNYQHDDDDFTEFDWHSYVTEHGSDESILAPPECFNQQREPPVNVFEENMKLEMKDPRGGDTTICLATIVRVYKQWVCVRLEGCDTSNDHWFICDHDELHPVGYANEQLQLSLAPPIGYQHNMARYKQHIEKVLRDSTAAPRDAFRPISPTLRPSKNLFNVGQKVEAVDSRNFSGVLYPSTIRAIDGDMLDVTFDGYPHGYNIRVKYDSRDIFPPGWGFKARVQVAPPPQQKVKRRRTGGTAATSKEQMPSDEASTQKKSRTSVETREKPTKAHKSTASSAPSKKKEEWTEGGDDQPLTASERAAAKARKAVPQGTTLTRKASPPPALPSPASTPDRPESSANRRAETVSDDERLITVHINGTCAVGPFLEPSSLRDRAPIGPHNIMHGLHESLQLLLNAATYIHRATVVQRIRRATGTYRENVPHKKVPVEVDGGERGRPAPVTLTTDIGQNTITIPVPYVDNVTNAWYMISLVLSELESCRNLFARNDAACKKCCLQADSSEPTKTSTQQEAHNESGVMTALAYQEAINNAMHWSVEEVVRRVSELEDETIANAIRQHAIDGRALFLLNTDLMVKYMNIKFGPALKLQSWIDNFKQRINHLGRNVRQQRT